MSDWHRPRRKDHTLADWQQLNAPEGKADRLRALETQLKLTPKFWSFIVEKCSEVNGATEGQAGNSESS